MQRCYREILVLPFPVPGVSVRSLKYMARFARKVDSQSCNSYCTIPWGHIVKLLEKTDPGEERERYKNAIVENGWLQVVLDLHRLKTLRVPSTQGKDQ